MNKRIICIVLAMLLLIPFVLTACSKELTEDEIIDKIVNSGSKALTLSIWVPTNANVNDQSFKDRVDAVEEAINAILRDKNYSTMIEIEAYPVDKYEKALNDRFTSMEQSVSKDFGGQLPSIYSQGYVNKAEKVPVGNSYMYELAYPKVINSQLDIFYISGYDNYLSYVNAGNVHGLKEYVDDGAFADINKMISPKILEKFVVGKDKYALPNNHLYTKDTTYQFVLVDTELLNAYKEQKDLDDDFKLESILACEDFINFVGENYTDYVPFVGTVDDAPGIYSFDSSNLIAGSTSNANPSSVFEIEEYNKYISMLKRLNSSYVKSELAEGEKSAVSFFYGTKDELAALGDKYTAIKSEMPVADKESVYESMFAISKYSIDYDRAMKMLYILQSNEEIITLLQYGIEGVDYEIVQDKKTGTEKVVRNEKSPYDMSGLILGNSYFTHKLGESPDYNWDEEKSINYDLVVDPYMNLFENYDSKATEEEKAQLSELLSSLNASASSIQSAISKMSAEEYEEFVELYAVDYEELVESIEKLEKKEELTSEEKTELKNLTSIKKNYDSNKTITLINSTEYNGLIEVYQKLYNSYK